MHVNIFLKHCPLFCHSVITRSWRLKRSVLWYCDREVLLLSLKYIAAYWSVFFSPTLHLHRWLKTPIMILQQTQTSTYSTAHSSQLGFISLPTYYRHVQLMSWKARTYWGGNVVCKCSRLTLSQGQLHVIKLCYISVEDTLECYRHHTSRRLEWNLKLESRRLEQRRMTLKEMMHFRSHYHSVIVALRRAWFVLWQSESFFTFVQQCT